MQSSNRLAMNRHERPAWQQYLASGNRGKNPEHNAVDSDSNHEQLSTEKASIHGRRAVSIMGYNVGQRFVAVGQYRTACGRRRHRLPTGWGARHAALPRTRHEGAEQPPTAAEEEPGEQQRPRREPRTGYCPGHVGRSMNAHELVSNNNPSTQEGKEATGHSSGQQ